MLLDSLNTLRRSLNLTPVTSDSALLAASRMHARYLMKNGFRAPSFHLESAKKPGFVGVMPWNRDMSLGWPTPDAGEVGMEWSDASETATMTQDLVDTVFHRLSLLSANLTQAGAALGSGPNGALVMDLGFGYRSNLPQTVVYPYNGQRGVPTGWHDIESPDPVPNGYGRVFGYPITLDFPTADTLRDAKISLSRGFLTVPTYFDKPGRGDMSANQMALVPRASLRPHAWYTVRASAQAEFNDGSRRPVRVQWRFRTGGSDQSLAATVTSSQTALLAVVRTGSGVPQKNVPLTLFRTGRPMPVKIGEGATNDNGLWRVSRTKGGSGYYEAVSSSGNRVVFWWGAHG
jgi:hypothetical protein